MHFVTHRRHRRAISVGAGSVGFSLVELMVTVAVLAVIMAIAFPNLTGLVNGNRLTGNANEMVTALQLARSEAITRSTSVAVCATSNDATCDPAANWSRWITVIVSTGEVLRVSSAKAPIGVLASPAVTGNANRVVFRSDGMARTNAGALLGANFAVCIANSKPVNNQRTVSLASGSRVSVASVEGAGACPVPANP